MNETAIGDRDVDRLFTRLRESGAEIAEFTDQHGVRNFYYSWRAEHPKAVVQIVHGLGDHAGRYLHVAQYLVANGYHVIADDHLGHGATGRIQYQHNPILQGTLGKGGLFGAIRNVHTVTSIAKTIFPGMDVVLFGHSWGSFMSQRIINSHGADYRGLILTGTGYAMPGWISSGAFNRKYETEDLTGMAWLSRDAQVAQDFVDDPLTTSLSLLTLFGLVDGLRMYVRPRRYVPSRLPVLIMNGSEDPVAAPRSVARLAKAYHDVGVKDVTCTIFPDARHEVVNETNQGEVLIALREWLDARFGL